MALLARTFAIARTQCTSQVRYAAAAAARSAHSLPDLAYEYGALEPSISATIMEIHHSKHHQTYVNGLNAAEESLTAAVAANDVSKYIELHSAIKFNGGGHLNHALFFENLAPAGAGGGGAPSGALGEAIDSTFGSFDEFKATFSAKTAAVQGSGWGWLGFNPADNSIAIVTCPNQDPLHATTGYVPLLGVDIWEHAYYLDYQNVRPNYLGAIWDVVNWGCVADRYAAATA